MGATVVSGVDAPPVFGAPEHVFDRVALFIEDGVMRDGDLPIGFRGDAGDDAALCEGGAEPIGVVTLVGQELLGSWHGGQHQRRAPVVAHLAFAQQHDERASAAVAERVQLGVQAAFGAPDTSGEVDPVFGTGG